MTISEKAIDRLFHRLSATYGSDFLGRYKGQTENDLKAVWMHELASFEHHLGMLAWALENLPERAPNVIEFRNLARRAPQAEVPRLPEPAADIERVNRELSKLGGLRKQLSNNPGGGWKDWAWALKARDEAGEKMNVTVRAMYKSALRLES
jgi:hypothetical protein